jgi:hypothetical protein
MNTISRLFAVACILCTGFTSFAGCAANSAPPTETTQTPGIETAPDAKVVSYDASDIAALKPGEFLRLDLTRPNTVYVVKYTDPADLDHVVADKGTSQYIVGQRAPASAKAQDNALKQIVLSGDAVMDTGSGESVAPPSGDESIGTAEQPLSSDFVVSCQCPCCIIINNTIAICCS